MVLFLIFILLPLGIFAQSEETETMRALRLGCDKQRQGFGCVGYANLLLKQGETEKADSYFEKACYLNFKDGCDKKQWELNKNEEETVTPTISPTSTME